jgi:hypothetical protein
LRNVLFGTVSPNGQFVIVVERGCTRLLTLHGAYHGGIGISARLDWPTKIRKASTDNIGVSAIVREEYGALELVAIDCRGHVNFARISVPYMPEPVAPRLSTSSSVMLDSSPISQLPARELPVDWDSNVIWGQEEDRITVIPG